MNFKKVMGTSKLTILVPLFYLKFLNGIRRLQVAGTSKKRHYQC